MIRATSFCLCLGLCAVFNAAQATTQPSTEIVMYQQELGEGRKLVVTKEPVVLASALKDLLPPSIVDRANSAPTGFFSINVELRFASGQSLRLWSDHRAIHRERPTEYGEYQVLDVVVMPNRILLAMATVGSQIYLHEISVYGRTQSYGLPGLDWNLLAAAIPAPPGRLSAKWSYDERQKLVQIEVVDFLQETKQHTFFEQKGDAWEFVRVKQWQETVPATQPGK